MEQPSILVRILHSIPHVNYTFQRVNDTFNPDSDVYLEVSAHRFAAFDYCLQKRKNLSEYSDFKLSSLLWIKTLHFIKLNKNTKKWKVKKVKIYKYKYRNFFLIFENCKEYFRIKYNKIFIYQHLFISFQKVVFYS